MIIHNIRQRSAEWHKLRRGIPTASDFDRIILPSGKPSGQAKKFMHQLAYERLLDKDFDRPNLAAVAHVQYGIINEDRAALAFEQLTGLTTTPVGFITDDEASFGCSPDRMIAGQHEALEIKCPTGPVQCGYLMSGLEDAYKAQLQGQILIGSFPMIHFYAWSDELPPFYIQVRPDPDFLLLLLKYLTQFNIELARGVAHIRSLGHWPSNAPSVFPDEIESY